MTAFLWPIALPLLLALARLAGPRWERSALLLAWIVLTLFIGLRREVGADWDNYILMHARAGAYSLAEGATMGDPAYMLLGGAMFRFGLALPAVNLVCAAIFSTGLILLVRAQPVPALALAIALPVIVGIAAFTTRQAAALGLLMAALALIGTGRPRLAAGLVLVAPAFHWTAILLLPLIPATLTRAVPPRLSIAAGAAAGIALAMLLGFTALADRFDHIPASIGAVPRGGLTLVTLIVLAATWREIELDARLRPAVALLAGVGLFALALTPVLSTAADRIGYYAAPLQMIVLPRALALVGRPGLRRLAQIGTGLFHAALLAAWLALTPYRGCLMPYRSYLADPAAVRDVDPQTHRRTLLCVSRKRPSAGQEQPNLLDGVREDVRNLMLGP